jgi:hypothetical protein
MVDAAWLERVTTATLRRAVWHQVKTLAFVPDLWSSDDRLGPLRASFPGSSSEFDLLLDLALDIYLEGVIDFGLSVGRAATEDLRDGMAFVATVPERTWAELPTELQIVCAVATAGSDPGSWAPPLQACLRAFHWTRNLEVLIGTYRDLRDDVS